MHFVVSFQQQQQQQKNNKTDFYNFTITKKRDTKLLY